MDPYDLYFRYLGRIQRGVAYPRGVGTPWKKGKDEGEEEERRERKRRKGVEYGEGR